MTDRRRFPRCGFTFDGTTCNRKGEHLCAPRVAHVHQFFSRLLVHTKGDWARRPFVPAPWQSREILTPLFGTVVFDSARRRYVRRYRELYLFVARKNGKTEILAGIVLYLLVADSEEGAEIYGLALDRDQASLVYRVAARMVALSPTLRRRLDVVRSLGRIVDESSASVYAVIAGDWAGSLGTNPHGAVIDELLTQPSRELYDAIRTGFGARAQPLLLMATTAENDPNGFAASERIWSEQVLADPGLDPSRLVVMYRADPDADWTEPETWRQANPALGDFLEMRVLRDECAKAQANPAAERAFRQYRLNQPVGAVGRAIDMAVWDSSSGPIGYVDIPANMAGRSCYGGLDLASTSDLAAYALDFPDGEGGHDVIWRCFAPQSALRDLDRRTGGRATAWANAGLLTVTPGNVIDYAAIREAINADAGRFDIREIGFDRWGATQLAVELMDDGVPLIQMGQGFATMAGPTRELLRLSAAGVYRHGGNPLTRWQASNAVTRSDPAGNLKFDKARSVDKIDGIVAATMALDRAIRHTTIAPEPDYAAAGF